MDARYTGFDGGTFGICSVRVRRVVTILAVACLVGFTTPNPATAVLVSRDGTYYRPSLPASTEPVVQSCPNDVCATVDVSDFYEDALQSAIAALEPFTIKVGKKTEIDVENLAVSFSCIDLRQKGRRRLRGPGVGGLPGRGQRHPHEAGSVERYPCGLGRLPGCPGQLPEAAEPGLPWPLRRADLG